MNSPSRGQKHVGAQSESLLRVGRLLAHAPQAVRIEAKDHHPSLGHQHALDLPQGLVRVTREFERMRKHHEIQALAVEGQGIEVAIQRNGATVSRESG